ncbi:unnamed protein product [Eruca vesicaria subsp. sativa]|uniref:Uncharacterized protein n=1 Tax=Eruca vesicaria subsp. sativa TaxID=29727 RepID=A0ABC8J574_ERUVS|nr:unnamed protein product [Eruca vesicaria subsp. sativa]
MHAKVSVAPGDSRVLSNGKLVSQQNIGLGESRSIPPVHPRYLESYTPSPRPIRKRLEFPTTAGSEGGLSSRERRSALEHIADPDLRGFPPLSLSGNSDSVRLHDVEILYEDGVDQEPLISQNFPSSSRVPVSLCLGASHDPDAFAVPVVSPPATRASGKRKASRAPIR